MPAPRPGVRMPFPAGPHPLDRGTRQGPSRATGGKHTMKRRFLWAMAAVVAADALLLGQGGDASKSLADARTAMGGDKLAAVKTLTGNRPHAADRTRRQHGRERVRAGARVARQVPHAQRHDGHGQHEHLPQHRLQRRTGDRGNRSSAEPDRRRHGGDPHGRPGRLGNGPREDDARAEGRVRPRAAADEQEGVRPAGARDVRHVAPAAYPAGVHATPARPSRPTARPT